jgi:hypothetical protein
MHFIYEWSGNSLIVGVFAPVNESIWEHLKLIFWPMLLWWFVGYLVLQKNHCFNAANWPGSRTVVVLLCPIVITSFYYTYSSALGIESFMLDIFSLVLGVTLAQSLALHIYNYAKCGKGCVVASFAVLILLAILFTVFTLAPPSTPLFQDSITKRYGI